jgi:ABC-type phosphate transport system substrate-binding protein
MKLNTKLLAIGATALAASFQAQAFGPTQAPDFVFYVGGGSAQGGAFIAFAEKLMTPGFDVYTDQATCATDGANYRAVFGTVGTTLPDGSSTPASLVGKKVLVEYGNNGGTFANGIDGLARSHAIIFQNYINSQGTNNTVSCGGSRWSTGISGTAVTSNHVPDIGFSDEEVTLFTGTNLPAATSALTSTELSKISTFPLYENVFGVAETNLLAAQKKNFSKFELTGIESGAIKNWSQVKGDVGSFNGVALPAGPVVFIDRNSGSGSKAAWNAYFLHNPSSKAFGGTVPPKVSTNANIGDCTNFTVNSDCAQSSNGNVKAALDAANGKAARAVGILGLEFQPAATDSYVFGNINGVAINGITSVTCGNAVPNAFEPANVVSGAHDLFFTNSFQYRTASVNGASFEGDGSAASDFMDAFLIVASDPATEVSVPGLLLDPDVSGAPSGNPWDACITRGTRHQNSTAPLQFQF